jgi:hypothetical protein
LLFSRKAAARSFGVRTADRPAKAHRPMGAPRAWRGRGKIPSNILIISSLSLSLPLFVLPPFSVALHPAAAPRGFVLAPQEAVFNPQRAYSRPWPISPYLLPFPVTLAFKGLSRFSTRGRSPRRLSRVSPKSSFGFLGGPREIRSVRGRGAFKRAPLPPCCRFSPSLSVRPLLQEGFALAPKEAVSNPQRACSRS